MNKILLSSIATLLVIYGCILAEEPKLEWLDKFEELQCNTSGRDAEINAVQGAVINIVTRKPYNPDSPYSSVMRKLRQADGALLGMDVKNIDSKNTVAQTACTGENGEITTAGFWYNGSNNVFWISSWNYSTGWYDDLLSESEETEQANQVFSDESGSTYLVGTTWSKEWGPDVTLIKYNSNHVLEYRTRIEDTESDDIPYGIIRLYNGSLGLAVESDTSLKFFDIAPTGTLQTTTDYPGRVNKGFIHTGSAYPLLLEQYTAEDNCFYICGTLYTGSGKDIWVACCDYDGNYLWEKVFDSGYDDWAFDITGGFGYVYVVGSSGNGSDMDCRMIRYDQAGNETWNITYDNGIDEELNAITLDPQGNFYVTGYTEEDTVQSALLIKYSQPDVVSIEEQPSPSSEPSSLTLEILDNLSSSPTIRYSIPRGQHATLTFYAANGRKIDSFTLDAAQSAFSWITDRPSGVYFARLQTGESAKVARFVKTR